MRLVALLGYALVACGGSQSLDAAGGAGGMSGEAGSAGSAGSASECEVSLPSPELIAATPRADTNLELLALKLSTGVIAEQRVYDRVVRDVGAIRDAAPDLADIGYYPEHDGRALFLALEPDTAARMKSGQYRDWDCLNRAYVVEDTQVDDAGFAPHALLTLKGIYDLKALALDYGALPGVTGASPNIGGGDGPTICVTREADTWHYVLDRASGDCLSGCTEHRFFHFSTEADGALSDRGEIEPKEASRYTSADACR